MLLGSEPTDGNLDSEVYNRSEVNVFNYTGSFLTHTFFVQIISRDAGMYDPGHAPYLPVTETGSISLNVHFSFSGTTSSHLLLFCVLLLPS